MKKLLRSVAVTLVLFGAVAYGAYWLRTLEHGPLDRETATALASANGRAARITGSSVGWTAYEAAGPDTGRVAVLVHGFSVPMYIWDSTFTALANAGYRVIRYDLLGRGLSERADVSYGAETYDAQLSELLDSLNVTGPVDLFGLSFGGFVTTFFTAEHPDRVRTLVLVDPVVRTSVATGFQGAPVIGRYLFELVAAPKAADGQPTDFLHPEAFPGWADRYREQQRYTGFARALHRTRIEMGGVDLAVVHERIAKAGTPVMLVWGRQDPTIPFEQSKDLLQRIPTIEFLPVDSSGHLPHLEHSAQVNGAILEWLAKHAPPAPPPPPPAGSARR